jgi:hypothetical protein
MSDELENIKPVDQLSSSAGEGQTTPLKGTPAENRKKTRVKIRIASGEKASSGSGRSNRRKKKAKGSGISYSTANASNLSGYRLWIVGFLIFGGCVLMAYLVLSRLGGPPPLPPGD